MEKAKRVKVAKPIKTVAKSSSKPIRKKKVKENFIRIDIKHKSFASKGYKKLNVQKYKRKKFKKLQRDKCFKCGESGHWLADCPNNAEDIAKKALEKVEEEEAEIAELEALANEETNKIGEDTEAAYEIPADHRILCDEEDDDDSDEFHRDEPALDRFAYLR